MGSFHFSPSELYASVVIRFIYTFVINAGIYYCLYLNSDFSFRGIQINNKKIIYLPT